MSLQNQYYKYEVVRQQLDIAEIRDCRSLEEAYPLIFQLFKAQGLDESDFNLACFEYLFEKFGQPTWHISPDLIPFLEAVDLDAQIQDILVPKDILNVHFPYPFEVSGKPCRYIQLGRMASDLSRKTMGNVTKLGDECDSLWIQTRFPKNPNSDWHSNDGGWAKLNLPTWHEMSIKETLDSCIEGLPEGKPEYEALFKMTQMALAAILYTQAEPVSVERHRTTKKGKKQKLPSNVRYVNLIPKIRYVNSEDSGQSRTVRPHLRGWTLRTLRHPRYHRNPDGSPRTILVEPHLVGTSKVEDVEDKITKMRY
jgi:hypothetical protein